MEDPGREEGCREGEVEPFGVWQRAGFDAGVFQNGEAGPGGAGGHEAVERIWECGDGKRRGEEFPHARGFWQGNDDDQQDSRETVLAGGPDEEVGGDGKGKEEQVFGGGPLGAEVQDCCGQQGTEPEGEEHVEVLRSCDGADAEVLGGLHDKGGQEESDGEAGGAAGIVGDVPSHEHGEEGEGEAAEEFAGDRQRGGQVEVFEVVDHHGGDGHPFEPVSPVVSLDHRLGGEEELHAGFGLLGEAVFFEELGRGEFPEVSDRAGRVFLGSAGALVGLGDFPEHVGDFLGGGFLKDFADESRGLGDILFGGGGGGSGDEHHELFGDLGELFFGLFLFFLLHGFFDVLEDFGLVLHLEMVTEDGFEGVDVDDCVFWDHGFFFPDYWGKSRDFAARKKAGEESRPFFFFGRRFTGCKWL